MLRFAVIGGWRSDAAKSVTGAHELSRVNQRATATVADQSLTVAGRFRLGVAAS